VCEPTSHSGSQAFALPQLDAAAMRRQLRKCPSAPLFRDNLTPWHDNLVFRRRQLLGFNFQFCLSIFLSLGEKKPVSAKEKRRLTSQPRERGSSSTGAPYSSNWNRRRHGLALLFSDTAMLANAIATAIDPNVIAHAALSKKIIRVSQNHQNVAACLQVSSPLRKDFLRASEMLLAQGVQVLLS
jgi:hypothetical protein